MVIEPSQSQAHPNGRRGPQPGRTARGPDGPARAQRLPLPAGGGARPRRRRAGGAGGRGPGPASCRRRGAGPAARGAGGRAGAAAAAARLIPRYPRRGGTPRGAPGGSRSESPTRREHRPPLRTGLCYSLPETLDACGLSRRDHIRPLRRRGCRELIIA